MITNPSPLRLSVLLLLLAPSLGAQDAAPSTLQADELIDKTRAAIEELTGLESSTVADRDAFERSETEDTSDRHRRMQTISNTTTATISVLVWTIAIVYVYVYVFARLGLDVTPIVASASVLGLAVAFGAQALIKDFFYGFFILIENQFTIGDVVTLGSITGTVEKISLRITVLRDLEGVVHYIPNGTIIQVSNKTQGWSRVVMEVSVTYKEDPDHVSSVLGDILLEMAQDDLWRRDIVEDPVVAGVQNLTERSVDIRVMIKTRPGKQWAIGREARRRIKKRFDELGIEVPFPQRVVHHVYHGEAAAGPRKHIPPPKATARSNAAASL